MVITKETPMPSVEELKVKELHLTSGPLIAAAHHLGKYCDFQCKEFMLCWQENLHDPRACLKEGKDVTACGLEFFSKVKKSCALEFTNYFNCVEKKSGLEMNLEEIAFSTASPPIVPFHFSCRKQQTPFDECIQTHLGQERPEYGYFSKVRIHETARPKPQVNMAPMPERIPELPDFDKMPDPEDMKYKKKVHGILPGM